MFGWFILIFIVFLIVMFYNKPNFDSHDCFRCKNSLGIFTCTDFCKREWMQSDLRFWKRYSYKTWKMQCDRHLFTCAVCKTRNIGIFIRCKMHVDIHIMTLRRSDFPFDFRYTPLSWMEFVFDQAHSDQLRRLHEHFSVWLIHYKQIIWVHVNVSIGLFAICSIVKIRTDRDDGLI